MYLWQEFNIKTFSSETIVFKDGVFMPDLSTLGIRDPGPKTINIDKSYDLPIHIIYVGEILGENNLDIEINAPDQKVFLTAKFQNKKPAFFNVFVKNTGKNSSVSGKVLAQNYSDLKINIIGRHLNERTSVLIETKVAAHKNTTTKLTGCAEIYKNCENCESNIGFSVLADPSASVEFEPTQLISAAPKSAEHSAALYRGAPVQIEYLRTAGLSGSEIKEILEEAFLN